MYRISPLLSIDVPYNRLDHHIPIIDASMYSTTETFDIGMAALEILVIAHEERLLQFLTASSWT
jgi:hypothetical protein